MTQRLLHIYCGDGKGKTTAATGLAVRAAGCKMRVLFTRFLKNEHSGELSVLDNIPEIEVIHLEKSFGFFYTLTEKEKEEARQLYRGLWNEIVRRTKEESFDMLVMDEFMAAYQLELIEHDEAIEFLKAQKGKMEVVLTGRNPDCRLLELADYVSEIQMVKHPFEQGIPARRGIEF